MCGRGKALANSPFPARRGQWRSPHKSRRAQPLGRITCVLLTPPAQPVSPQESRAQHTLSLPSPEGLSLYSPPKSHPRWVNGQGLEPLSTRAAYRLLPRASAASSSREVWVLGGFFFSSRPRHFSKIKHLHRFAIPHNK